MTMLNDVYYAAWASLSVLSVTERAAVVLAVAVLFVWLIARPILFKLLALLCRMGAGFVKAAFVINGKIIGLTAKRTPERYAAAYNGMADFSERCYNRMLERSAKLAARHKFHFFRMVIVYGILILLIALPDFVGKVVSEEYLPYFSGVSNLYQKIEGTILEKSRAYPPLFPGSYNTVEEDLTFEEVEPDEDEPEEDAPEEVWLSLSEIGRYGANVRAAPGANNRIVATLANDDKVLYLNEQSKGWVYIRTTGGIEGWINSSLLTNVPEIE